MWLRRLHFCRLCSHIFVTF